MSKTSAGYTAIEHLSVGDLIFCFDDDNNCVERPITNVVHKCVPRYVCVQIRDESVDVSGAQQLYDAQEHKWVAVAHLKNNSCVLTHQPERGYIKSIQWVDELIEVYCLSVAEYHNFFISRADICAHNFPPVVIGLAWAFGGGVIEWLGASVGIAGLGGLYYKFAKKSGNNACLSSVSFSNSMMPDGPEDEDEKKRKRDEACEEYRSLTSKRAKEIAEDRGYRKAKSNPCGNTRNKPVFFNGKQYISPDADGHKGGAWKVFNRFGKRMYTMNIDLTKVIGD